MENYYYLFLLVSGIVGGFLGGMIGIGGGMIFILILPVTLLHAGVPEGHLVQYTIANSLFGTMVSAMAAHFSLVRQANFHPRPALFISGVSIVITAVTIKFIVNTPLYSPLAFNLFIVGLLGYMIIRTWLKAKTAEGIADPRRSLVGYGVTGLASGIVSPLSGLGGGVVIVPILNTYLGFPIKVAKSISLTVIGVTSLASVVVNLSESSHDTLKYYSVGYIILPVALALSAGVIVGAPLGVNTARRLPSPVISYLFVGFLSIVLFRKIWETIVLVF